MFDRVLAFLSKLPSGAAAPSDAMPADDPRVAAAALMYHLMDADGVRQDIEWERLKEVLGESYGLEGEALDALVAQAAAADQEAVDLYAFTSVLKRELDMEARVEFVRLMWEIVYADGELHELEDHLVWRIAELIGVDRRDRITARQQVERQQPGTLGSSTEED